MKSFRNIVSFNPSIRPVNELYVHSRDDKTEASKGDVTYVSYSYKARTKEEEFEPDRSPKLVHFTILR